MYNKTLSATLLMSVALLIFSCGKSEQEKVAEQKRVTDSIVNVGAQRVKDSLDYAQKQAQIEERKEEIGMELQTLKASFIAENAKMDEIKEFNLLRTASEKDEQINNQAILIQSIEGDILKLNTELNSLQ